MIFAYFIFLPRLAPNCDYNRTRPNVREYLKRYLSISRKGSSEIAQCTLWFIKTVIKLRKVAFNLTYRPQVRSPLDLVRGLRQGLLHHDLDRAMVYGPAIRIVWCTMVPQYRLPHNDLYRVMDYDRPVHESRHGRHCNINDTALLYDKSRRNLNSY